MKSVFKRRMDQGVGEGAVVHRERRFNKESWRVDEDGDARGRVGREIPVGDGGSEVLPIPVRERMSVLIDETDFVDAGIDFC